jgi:hypothetical protein
MPPVGTAARSPPIESSVLRSGSRCLENQVVDLISATQGATCTGATRSGFVLSLPRRLRPIARIRVSVSFAAPRPADPTDHPDPEQ